MNFYVFWTITQITGFIHRSMLYAKVGQSDETLKDVSFQLSKTNKELQKNMQQVTTLSTDINKSPKEILGVIAARDTLYFIYNKKWGPLAQLKLLQKQHAEMMASNTALMASNKALMQKNAALIESNNTLGKSSKQMNKVVIKQLTRQVKNIIMQKYNLTADSEQLIVFTRLVMDAYKKIQNTGDSGSFASLSSKFTLADLSREQVSSEGTSIELNRNEQSFMTTPNIVFLGVILLILQVLNYKRQPITAPESPNVIKNQKFQKIDPEEPISPEERGSLVRGQLSNEELMEVLKDQNSFSNQKNGSLVLEHEVAKTTHKLYKTFFRTCQTINGLSQEINTILEPNLQHTQLIISRSDQLNFLTGFEQYMEKVNKIFNIPAEKNTLMDLAKKNDQLRECLQDSELMISQLKKFRDDLKKINFPM